MNAFAGHRMAQLPAQALELRPGHGSVDRRASFKAERSCGVYRAVRISRGHSVSVRVKPELFIGVRAVTSQFLTKSIRKIGAVLRPPKC